MSIIKCKECGKEISSKAKICPNCGAPFKKKSGCLIITIILVLFLFFLLIVGTISNRNFEDIGYYKVDTNNGSHSRVFSVYVKGFKDTPDIWEDIRKYAEDKMYSAGGMTIVFFFNDKDNTPDVTFTGAEFDKRYEKYCVAGYWKYPNGKVTFYKYPFK